MEPTALIVNSYLIPEIKNHPGFRRDGFYFEYFLNLKL